MGVVGGVYEETGGWGMWWAWWESYAKGLVSRACCDDHHPPSLPPLFLHPPSLPPPSFLSSSTLPLPPSLPQRDAPIKSAHRIRASNYHYLMTGGWDRKLKVGHHCSTCAVQLCSHLIGQFWDTHQPNPNFKRKGYSVSAHMGCTGTLSLYSRKVIDGECTMAF